MDTFPRAFPPPDRIHLSSAALWPVLLIVCCTTLAYSNSLLCPFVFDDLHNIVDNQNLRKLWPLENLLAVLGGVNGVVSRPLIFLSFAVNYTLHGEAVLGYHLTNLVSIDEITPDIWNKFVAVNLSGAWYLTKAAQPHMKAKGWGRIINVTTSFFTMLRGRFHPYGPVKAGLEAMSAGHAAEFAPDGITVNVVVPGGPSDTDIVPEAAPYARQDLIQPAQMVPPILWLCSDTGGEVTGSRFVAANWDASLPVAEARAASEAPIAWPDLAGTPVWPGGKPDE